MNRGMDVLTLDDQEVADIFATDYSAWWIKPANDEPEKTAVPLAAPIFIAADDDDY